MSLFTTDLDEYGRWSPFHNPRRSDIPTDRSLKVDGIELRYFRAIWPWAFAVSPDLWRALSRRLDQFDAVHIHSLYLFTSVAAARSAAARKIPYLVRPHGTLDPYLRRRHRLRKGIYGALIERRSLNEAAGIHFTSSDELELAAPLRLKAPGFVVPLGIDAEPFTHMPRANSFKKQYPELTGRRLVVFIGRLAQKKGLDLLVEAFQIVRGRVPEAHLVIAGPDDEGYGQHVRRLVRDAALTDRVTFTGMLAEHAILELLSDTDVWALPSYSENFGMAVVEALAAGVPVVISDRVAIHREVAQAEAGLIVRCDAREVADAVCAILASAHLRHRLSERGPILVRSHFSWDSSAKQLIEIYREIIRGSVGARAIGKPNT